MSRLVEFILLGNVALRAQKDHVRQIVRVLASDFTNIGKVLDKDAIPADELAAIDRASSEGFWADFDKDPLEALEFLENRIAPLASDADMLFLRYIGTDPSAFNRCFDRMKIVDGMTIPPGKRGFLFSKWVYEQQVKLKTAHRMDKIHDAISKLGKTIASDLELQRWVKLNSNEVREILLQLDSMQTARFREIEGHLLSMLHAQAGRVSMG